MSGDRDPVGCQQARGDPLGAFHPRSQPRGGRAAEVPGRYHLRQQGSCFIPVCAYACAATTGSGYASIMSVRGTLILLLAPALVLQARATGTTAHSWTLVGNDADGIPRMASPGSIERRGHTVTTC